MLGTYLRPSVYVSQNNYRMNAGVASDLDQRADVAGQWRD